MYENLHYSTILLLNTTGIKSLSNLPILLKTPSNSSPSRSKYTPHSPSPSSTATNASLALSSSVTISSASPAQSHGPTTCSMLRERFPYLSSCVSLSA